MGKKNRKLKKLIEKPAPASPGKKAISNSTTGFNSMTNWLVILLAVLPFLLNKEALDPTITSRYIFLGIFTVLFVLYFGAWKKKFSLPTATAVRIIFALGFLFGLWSLACMLNAINYREGYMDTARQFLNIFILFIVMTAAMQEEGQLIKIGKTLTLVALLQSWIGILQVYDIAFTEIPGSNAKPFGLMANRNFFGSAEAFLLPFACYMLYRGRTFWKYLAGFTLVSLAMAIILSQTRSAWLASLAFIIVSAICVIITSPVNRKKWIIGSGIGLALIAGLVYLFIFADTSGEISQSVRERAISLTGNLASSADAGENISERLKIWEKTVSVIKDHPVWGVGPGNWKIILPAYGTENMVFAKGYFSPDRPHNVYLQVASETGIPGALFYFGFWVMIAICGIAVIRKTTNEDTRILVILMLGGFSAVATDFMFSFPVDRIEHSLYMYLMGGIILGCYMKLPRQNETKPLPPGKIILISAAAIILFNIFLGLNRVNFEKHWKLARAYKSSGKYRESLSEVKAGKSAFTTLDHSGSPIEIFAMGDWKELKEYGNALTEIRQAARYNPYNPKTYNEWGTLYTDTQKYDSAVLYYNKAIRLAPAFEIAYKNLAVTYYNMGNDSACIQTIGKINTQNDEILKQLLEASKKRLAEKLK